MTADELIAAMRAALADEREAIRQLDRARIARANARKADILYCLGEAADAERPALYAALDELRAELRCNLVLLTHARAYLREAADLCSTPGGRAALEAELGVARRARSGRPEGTPSREPGKAA